MFALKFASYAHLILKMSKTSRNLRAFSWGKFSWTEMICVKNWHYATLNLCTLMRGENSCRHRWAGRPILDTLPTIILIEKLLETEMWWDRGLPGKKLHIAGCEPCPIFSFTGAWACIIGGIVAGVVFGISRRQFHLREESLIFQCIWNLLYFANC